MKLILCILYFWNRRNIFILYFTPRSTCIYEDVSKSFRTGEKRKWYSSLPLGAFVSLFCESV